MKKLTTGLKKGDKFEDGGRVFIIDQVLPNGDYISHIAAADGTTEETETTEGETEP